MSHRSLVLRLAAAAAACGSLGSATATSQTRNDLLRAVHEPTLERARDGAARKLERSECQRLLDEFKDKSGRSLSANLASWNRTPAEYLRTLAFRDGSLHPNCRSGKSELISVVGIPPVFVCPTFRKRAERDPWTAENWVIHEMLHTLGLGENPPSSREITQRVNERCQ
jgi:hypothetical protein